MISKALIIPAAGKGERMQREVPKPFIKLRGTSILEHTLWRFLELEGLRQIVVSTSAAFTSDVQKIMTGCVADTISWQCVQGGTERQHSIYNALEKVEAADLVIVHDAVRPFVKRRHIMECCRQAAETGAAIAAIPAKDTIKKVDADGYVTETPDRRQLWHIQTPQVFRKELLKKAYRKAADEGVTATDDASLVEWLGEPVKVVEADESNIKITYPNDLKLAELLLQQNH